MTDELREAVEWWDGNILAGRDFRFTSIIEAARAHLGCSTITDQQVRVACEKCCGTDIGTAYHKDGHACDYGRRGEAYPAFHDPSKEGVTCCRISEHLHRNCRVCGFGWADPVAAARVGTEKL